MNVYKPIPLGILQCDIYLFSYKQRTIVSFLSELISSQ